MVTLQLIPYSEIERLSSVGRIRKLLNEAKDNKIVLLQGRLKREEEAELIKTTMEEINRDFRGIELAVLNPTMGRMEGFQKFKNTMINSILGDRQGITIIGAASVVRSIKKDPNKIQLYAREVKKRKRR